MPCARASSSANYDKRDISPAELRAAYREADEQIHQALEPFGYYDSKVTKHLTGDATTGWNARFDVVARRTRHRSRGARRSDTARARSSGAWRRRWRRSRPKVGERLDHATYEASKSVIDTTLRGAGFLDAKYTRSAASR